MPETTIPFKDAQGTNQAFRGWQVDGVVTQALMIEDPTGGVRRVLTVGVDGKIGVRTQPSAAGASVCSSITASQSSQTLLAANAARLGATVYNDSAAVLCLKLGAAAGLSSFTCKLAAGAYYEVPFGYVGIIDGVWTAADGAARVTELTA